SAAGVAGVLDRGSPPPGLLADASDQRCNVRLLRYIRLCRARLATGLRDQVARFAEVAFMEARAIHQRTARSERSRSLAPDARARAGDEHDSILEIAVHLAALSRA